MLEFTLNECANAIDYILFIQAYFASFIYRSCVVPKSKSFVCRICDVPKYQRLLSILFYVCIQFKCVWWFLQC